MKIYRCNLCGNMMVVIEDGGVNPVCCNTNMEYLIPRTDEDLREKHVPEVRRDKCKVIVEVNHVMEDKHYIEAIMLETDKGFYTRYLKPGDKPCVSFELNKDEKPLIAYEYCNIHRLFKRDIEDNEVQDC